MIRHLRYTLLLGVVLSLVSFPTTNCSGKKCFSSTPFQREASRQKSELYKEYLKKGKCKDDRDCVVMEGFSICDWGVGNCGTVLHRDLVEEFKIKRSVIHAKCLLQIKDCELRDQGPIYDCDQPIPKCNNDGECTGRRL